MTTLAQETAGKKQQEYWTQERLEAFEEAMTENEASYENYLDSDERMWRYQSSTAELVRYLKTLPEWQGLSSSRAFSCVVVALDKINKGGGDPWSLLPDNELKGITAAEDFVETWEALPPANVLELAVEQAKSAPIMYTDDLKKQLEPITPAFKVFCDLCIYLQTAVGRAHYILLPVHKLAPLLGTKPSGVSTFSKRAEKAGLLERLKDHSFEEHRAIQWRCTRTFVRKKSLA